MECNQSILETKCLELRRQIIETAHKTSAGAHYGGSLSMVEILVALYEKANVSADEHRDRVILSKGHGALALYCILQQKGLLTEQELDAFEQNGAPLFAHAKRDVTKGIEFSGGSLSLGASFAIGVAVACRERALDNRIYVILGDGECNEGLVWESVMAAANYGLSNVTFIVDRNRIQSDGAVDEVMKTESLSAKFEAFGCKTMEVDGHDVVALMDALEQSAIRSQYLEGKPIAIIANTIKGKGVSFMENNVQWHHATISEKQYQQAMEELNRG